MRPLQAWQARTMAVALLVGSVAVVLATPDVGFTRDDSFYFGYAQSYQDWFVRVDRAETSDDVRSALGRDAVVRTWSGNFEHPPLMKAAFGFAWRLFARKDRPATVRGPAAGGLPTLRICRLGAAEGFAEGADVVLLGPLLVGQEPTDPDRELARGRVIERRGRDARVELVEIDDAAPPDLAALCRAARAGDPGPPRLMTGCQAREDRVLAVMSESAAMRLPGALATGLAVMLTFLLGLALFKDWLAGLVGALAFLFVPRHFFHGHLACFDMAAVFGTLAVLYAFWRSLDDRRWALGAAVLWGVALLMKHNAFFLPVPLVLFWLWSGRHELGLARRRWRFRLKLPKIPLALLVMPPVAFTMLFVLWPRLWYDPFRAFSAYFQFHAGHVHYMQWYFGEPLQVPPFPFEFPFVLTLYTVPLVFTFLALVGALYLAPPTRWLAGLRAMWRRETPSDNERAFVFIGLNGLIPILLIALPSIPIFGGVKHWMTGMPLILLLAGYGFARAVSALTARVRWAPLEHALGLLCAALILVQPVRASVDSVSYGTGYYNSLLAGGTQGGADRLMMRMYWGHTARQALAYVNEHAPKGARVFFQNTTHGSYEMYKRDGLLRDDIRYHHHPHGADIALIEPQKAFGELDIETRQALGVAGPAYEAAYEGVPMLRVYVKRSPAKAAAGPAPAEPQL